MTAARRALVVVDVQVDFCEGGSLPVTGGAAVAGAVSDYIERYGDNYGLIVATRDYHLDPAGHFADPVLGPDYVDTWPVHCVAGTPGAEYHPALHLPARVAHLRKGAHSAAYSGFQAVTEMGATLDELLQLFGITAVDVCGIAESHCVAATALDSAALGYPTRLLADLTVGVSAETTEEARAQMADAGIDRIDSANVFASAEPTTNGQPGALR